MINTDGKERTRQVVLNVMFSLLLSVEIIGHVISNRSILWRASTIDTAKLCPLMKGLAVQIKTVQIKIVPTHSESLQAYSLHPVSQKFPQHCLWNRFNVSLINTALSRLLQEGRRALLSVSTPLSEGDLRSADMDRRVTSPALRLFQILWPCDFSTNALSHRPPLGPVV